MQRPVIGVLLLCAACGGSGPPSITVIRPGPSSVQQPGTGSISGVVVGNQDRIPIPGARLSANATAAITNERGEFQLAGLPAGPVIYELSAAGRVTHTSQVNVDGSRAGITLDLIPDADPFSLGFYRQFARDGFERAALRATNPWTMAPSFYVRTVTDDTNEAMPPGIVAAVRRVIVNSVPELSAGRFTVAAFETGTESRPAQNGWVTVSFFSAFPVANAIGDASVGGNVGRIRLAFDAERRQPRLECEAWTVAVADHEIVHTMGFYHTGPPFGGGSDFDFQSGSGCPGSGRTARTRYHAAVMYSRPPGNSDPDYDPLSFASLTGEDRMPLVIRCAASLFR